MRKHAKRAKKTKQAPFRHASVIKHLRQLRGYDKLKPRARERLQGELGELNLLTEGANNAKLAKGEGKGFLSYILHLAPASASGFNVCPAASMGCIAACLNTAGHGRYQNTQDARIRKTLYYIKLGNAFLSHLWAELDAVQRKADKLGLQAVVRLNGTSDIAWENKLVDGRNVFQAFPRIQFYDYTKLVHRLHLIKLVSLPNYYLTFSASETNSAECDKALALGFNVAVVFDKVPTEYRGVRVINGDADDLRFTDARGVYVGLKAKGKAKRDVSGFVKRLGCPVKQAA